MKQFEFDMVGVKAQFDAECTGLGMNTKGYAGAFTVPVSRIIEGIINGFPDAKVLHLFSGISKLGHVRVDIERPEATDRMDVLEFIRNETRHWDFCILDPPYEIHRKSKLYEYGRVSSVAADVVMRNALLEFFTRSVDNVIWLDMCAPIPKGFERKKLWFLFPGGYHTLRVLSWLIRKVPF